MTGATGERGSSVRLLIVYKEGNSLLIIHEALETRFEVDEEVVSVRDIESNILPCPSIGNNI